MGKRGLVIESEGLLKGGPNIRARSQMEGLYSEPMAGPGACKGKLDKD